MSEKLKGKNLFKYNGIINTDNIPKNMFISITKEQYVEYMQQKETIEQQQEEIQELKKVIKMVEIYKAYGIPEDVEMVIMRKDDLLNNTNNEFISKDKIKEIIEKHYPDVAIVKLQELLEE